MLGIAYSSHYDLAFFGLERLHPFDTHKYSRVWNRLRKEFGPLIDQFHIPVDRQVTGDELRRVHTEEYLVSLRRSSTVASALELSPVRYLPSCLVDRAVLRPMRWAARGTVLAAERAARGGCAVNLSGGYHHAKPSAGEGFCVFSDIALAIGELRQRKLIDEAQHVAYIDLDAHQGNGVSHCFLEDRRVRMFDMFNATAYPIGDDVARARVDQGIALPPGCDDDTYLSLLENGLPSFLDRMQSEARVGFAIYVAGTDILERDPIGHLSVTAPAILRRDLFTINELRQRRIPCLMLLGGGYTRRSHTLVGDTIAALIREQAE